MNIREEFTCPVELATDLILSKWKTIILWELSSGKKRLRDLKKIKNINEKMLLQHLEEFIEVGLVNKIKYDTYPRKTEYYLSDFGEKVLPALEELQKFGNEYIKYGGMKMKNVLKEKALNLVKNSNNALIGSISRDGYPDIKAMLAPREIKGLREFFFTTNTSSLRVGQFRKNPKASLYFFNEKLFLGLLLEGEMKVMEDPEVKKRIWRDGDTMYYKKGMEDPDYCVLHFVCTKGRVYENFSSVDFEIGIDDIERE